MRRRTSSVPGVVVDEVGATIAGARVTVSDDLGVVLQTTTSDAAGAFALRNLVPGTYSGHGRDEPVLARPPACDGACVRLRPTRSRPCSRPAGFAESVVVTGRRVETRARGDAAEDRNRRRNRHRANGCGGSDRRPEEERRRGRHSIYGALSGIGIRGFRPQISGINKRSLLLIDGRPSGVTNLATLQLDNVERIEVLKGAASSVYGSSAMGGVVNVITRRSRGKVGGTARIGGGSFGTTELAGRAGGSASSSVDFDTAVNAVRPARRHPHGQRRDASGDELQDVRPEQARIGVELGGGWRIDGRAESYRGRDISTPPDIAAGTIGQGRKNLERGSGDARLVGRAGAHDCVVHRVSPRRRTATARTSRPRNPLDLPFLPYLSFESDARLDWRAGQGLVALVEAEQPRRRRGLRAASRASAARTRAPATAVGAVLRDSNKRTAGVYAENTVKLRDGRTVVAAGRADRSHHDRDGRNAAQDELHAVRDHVHRLQPEHRDQARADPGPARARGRRARVHPRRGADADRLHHDGRRRAHADHTGQSRPRARAEHVVRRRARSGRRRRRDST